jgi:hypothetical protein
MYQFDQRLFLGDVVFLWRFPRSENKTWQKSETDFIRFLSVFFLPCSNCTFIHRSITRFFLIWVPVALDIPVNLVKDFTLRLGWFEGGRVQPIQQRKVLVISKALVKVTRFSFSM